MLLKHLKGHPGMVVTWLCGARLHLSLSWLVLNLFIFLQLSYFQEFLIQIIKNIFLVRIVEWSIEAEPFREINYLPHTSSPSDLTNTDTANVKTVSFGQARSRVYNKAIRLHLL